MSKAVWETSSVEREQRKDRKEVNEMREDAKNGVYDSEEATERAIQEIVARDIVRVVNGR